MFKSKTFMFLFVSIAVLNGCRTINSALGRDKDEQSNQDPIIDTSPFLGEAPAFNIETPVGYSLNTIHAVLKTGNNVTLPSKTGETLFVFIKDAGFWFKIGVRQRTSFYYQRNVDSISFVHSYGNQEICVYQFIPLTEGLGL